jgi:hypothetical protein
MKLVDSAPSEPGSVNIDPYVPLQAQWGTSDSPLVYWRTGDLSRTLLELGIDSRTGVIRSLTLVLPGRVGLARPTDTLAGMASVPGLPVTDILGAREMYLDEPDSLLVLRGRGRLVFVMGERRPIHRVITAGRVRFGADASGRLAIIEVADLEPGEEKSLREGLALMPSVDSKQKGAGMKAQWVEVWLDSPSGGEYVLVVRGFSDGHVEIIDPQKAREQVAVFNHYEDATHWLDEEEYDLVEGRWTPEGERT